MPSQRFEGSGASAETVVKSDRYDWILKTAPSFFPLPTVVPDKN